MNKRSFWILTVSLALVKLLIHLLTATNYELHRDEMLYMAMGNHLDWGFASTPPLISFLSFIVIKLFGYQEFFVKLFPALFGSFMVVITALFIRELGGKSIAVFTGCFGFIAATAMLRTSSLFMPVIFELFFWFLFLFFVLKLINRQDPKYWIWIGVCAGLAFLNKYSVLFLAGVTFLAILISEHRKLIFSRYLIYGITIALVMVLPNVIWQIDHQFPVVKHMRELYSTQLTNVSTGAFLFEQLMMNFPAILIWLAGLTGVLFFVKEKKFRLFGTIFLGVMLLFLVAKGKPYYTLGIYPMMFAFGGYIIGKYFARSFIFVFVFSFVHALLLLPFGLPLLSQEPLRKYCAFFSEYITSAPMRSESGEYYPIPQDYTDMTGWSELADIASNAYNQLTEEEKHRCTLFANNYGQAGAMGFYGKRFGLPEPVCLSDSYIFWAPDSLTSEHFIVTDHQLGDIPELFNEYVMVGEVSNEFFRENGLKVFFCSHPKPLLDEYITSRIRQNKEIYGF